MSAKKPIYNRLGMAASEPNNPSGWPEESKNLSDEIIEKHKTITCSWCEGMGHTAVTWTARKHFKKVVSSLGPSYAKKAAIFTKLAVKKDKGTHSWQQEKEVLERAAEEAIKTIGVIMQTL